MQRLTVAEVVRRLGGQARAGQLSPWVTKQRLGTAVRRGEVVRLGRGLYALPDLPPARLVAAQARGVLSHTSAATWRRMPQVFPPTDVHVSVPHGSRPPRIDDVRYHWCTMPPPDIIDGVTDPVRTVLDSAGLLPFREALAVADSALRLDLVGEEELVREAAARKGPASAGGRRVAAAASADAANPFESALRGTLLEAGLVLVPQVEIVTAGLRARADLAEPRSRLVVEGDSFTHHGTRAGFTRDCRRYDELVRARWTVLRFTWEQVMFEPDWVAAVTAEVLGRLSGDHPQVRHNALPNPALADFDQVVTNPGMVRTG
jgi:very-short-patch-repair endonuclease